MSLLWYSRKSSGDNSEHYARDLVDVNVEVHSTRLASPTGDSYDAPYVVGNFDFDADEDYYDEDEDDDLEQADDVVSSSLVAVSSPYVDAVMHNNDLESYSVVRPRDLQS